MEHSEGSLNTRLIVVIQVHSDKLGGFVGTKPGDTTLNQGWIEMLSRMEDRVRPS